MEKWHAAKPNSIAKRMPAPSKPAARAGAAAVHAGLRRGAGARVRARPPRRRDHRRDELRHRAEPAPEGDARPLLRRRHRRAAGGPVRRRARPRGLAARRRRSTRPSCSARTTRSSTTCACRSCPSCSAMDRAGLVGDDGPTHHGAFDIAYLRCLPNITLMAPRDEAMLVHMLRTALLHESGPVAMRYPRGEAVGVPLPRAPKPLEIGTGEILREGERVAIVGYGSGVQQALGAADLLAEGGLDVTVADARFAKPLDTGLLAQLAAEHELLVTVEEGVLAGGFGTGVWEALSEGGAAPRILRVGLARPLRHARRAQAAARRGGLHARADRRADPERRARSARVAGVGLAARRVHGGWPLPAPADTVPTPWHACASTTCSRSVASIPRAPAPRPPSWPARCTSASGGAGPRSPASSSPRTSRSTSLPRRPTSRAAGSSWPTRSTRSGSTWPAAGRSTSAPRPAASRTACCSAAPRTWSRSTSPTASSRWPCATIRASPCSSGSTPGRSSRPLLPYRPDLVVADVSFISLTKVLPAVLARRGGAVRRARHGQAAVRGRPRAGRQGRRRARPGAAAGGARRRGRGRAGAGAAVLGTASSGLPGPAGNRETFLWLAEAGRPGALADLERRGRPGGALMRVASVLTHRRAADTASALGPLLAAAGRAGVELRFDPDETRKHGLEPRRRRRARLGERGRRRPLRRHGRRRHDPHRAARATPAPRCRCSP